MRKNVLAFAIIGLTLVGCGTGGKPMPVEDFTDLQSVDEKSDAFSKKLKLLGSLDYGQTSSAVKYTSSPTYRAFKFGGQKGDQIIVDVKSSNGGDAVAWVTDNAFKIVASNDDESGSTLDSHIESTLPGNSDPAIITYYLIFRDYSYDAATFKVSLASKDFFACNVDADCVAVPVGGCCQHGTKVAVNSSSVSAYAASVQCTVTPRPFCPLYIINDTRVAECNNTSKKCEMVAVDAIECNGFIRNSHKCPAGDQCLTSNPDVPGRCVDPTQPVVCGGIAGLTCGLGQICVDDPSAGCNIGLDPDCQGVCKTAPADCQTTGCGAGKTCTRCKAGFSCIPTGAVC